MSQYQATLPSDNSVKPEIAKYFETFYKISDTPDAHDLYTEQFTKDATLIMATSVSKGSDEILTKRKSMWEKVSARSHKPIKIFPFPSSSSGGGEEVMLYGTVDYVLKDGGKNVSVDWAARAHLVEQAAELKMDFYQVYLDTGAMAAAAAK
ncbi:hypothetical protein MBLNU230_g6552t1 [Neophaeotheca triangularis]